MFVCRQKAFEPIELTARVQRNDEEKYIARTIECGAAPKWEVDLSEFIYVAKRKIV